MKRDRTEYSKKYREENKEKLKQYYKEHYLKHKEERKQKSKEYYHNNKERSKEIKNRYLEENLELALFRSAKNRAKINSIDFNLSIEDIVIPEHCPYLGCKLSRILGKGSIWTNPSIDRIDNTKGYIKDNIEIISRKANTMKNQATKEELILFAKSILNKFDNP